jgi:Gly-Xaa carboxypeptidase
MRADTRYYWKLSRSIFRYNHKNTIGSKGRLSGVHTVNEGEWKCSYLFVWC